MSPFLKTWGLFPEGLKPFFLISATSALLFLIRWGGLWLSKLNEKFSDVKHETHLPISDSAGHREYSLNRGCEKLLSIMH